MGSIYRIGEFARLVGRDPATIRRWEREGKIVSRRLPSGQRYFDDSDVRMVLGHLPGKRRTVVYCRASCAGQRDDLTEQVRAMETYCLAGGIAVDEWIEELGGGMNFRRKRILTLLDRIGRGEIAKLLVAHRDRLVRFGFDWVEHVARLGDCELVVVNQDEFSPEREMVEDLLAIVHTFGSRMPEMYGYERQIRVDHPHCRRAAVPVF